MNLKLNQLQKSLQKSANPDIFSSNCDDDDEILQSYQKPQIYKRFLNDIKATVPTTNNDPKILRNGLLYVTQILLLDGSNNTFHSFSAWLHELIRQISQIALKYYHQHNNKKKLSKRPFLMLLMARYEMGILERTILEFFKTTDSRPLFVLIEKDAFAAYMFNNMNGIQDSDHQKLVNKLKQKSTLDFTRQVISVANTLIHPKNIYQNNGLFKSDSQLLSDTAHMLNNAYISATHIE